MTYWRDKVALITGGSAGFGKTLARGLASAGAHVAISGRDPQRLEACVAELGQDSAQVAGFVGDVTRDDQVDAVLRQTLQRFGRLDVLVNNAGRSARGDVLQTSVDEFRELLEINLLAVIRCTRAAVPHLVETKGHLINMGSLAAKTVSRFLGAYPSSKSAMAAYSHQLRLELASQGVHVLLVCPGPIARDDAGRRYEEQAVGLPPSARQPGGGVKLKGIRPDALASRVLRACERRQPELVMPSYAKLLFALSQLAPAWGDWIIGKMTSHRE